jgi:glycosyltransferase involved in cell wall biosynthesis
MELLNDDRVDVYFMTPSLNVALANKVKLLDHNYHIINFHSNPDFVRDVVNVLEPDYLVVNSFASEFLNLTDVFAKYKTIQYVHEDFDDYIPHQVSVEIESDKILCVDHNTRKRFKDVGKKTIIYHPKFRRSAFEEILDVYPSYRLLDVWTLAKWSMRKVIGMIGTPCQRKNYDLFMKIAKSIPEYEFVWVGGKSTFSDGNFTVIEKTQYATSYIAQFDIFFLSSQTDLCPVVLLEALALNIQSMVFQKNIGYKHGKSQHMNSYNRNINELSMKSIQNKIERVLNKKVNHKLPTGREYIEKSFIYEPGEFLDLID